MNKQFENYFVKALHDAKIEEISTQYQARGFITQKHPSVNGGQADLVVQNQTSGKQIIFEVGILPLSQEALADISELQQYTEALGHEFRLITITKPTRYEIDIDWFQEQLFSYLIEHPIAEIEEKATHILIEEVWADVESIAIEGTRASIQATGTITVTLQYGSNSEQSTDFGLKLLHTFPFEGEFDLDLAEMAIVNANLRIDDSDW
ncbi:MAG: hypothetical protein R3C14_32405 [Caldilineaceae bacterium]